LPLIRIETVADPRLADYRGVADPALLRGRRLFVAEGRAVVQRVIEDARWRVSSVLVNESARRALEPTLATLAPSIPVFVCEAADFLHVTGYPIHRGCLALVERPAPLELASVIADSRLVVALERVTNADNVGGVFRNAAAFGADAVLLSPGCCSPLYRKAVRTSMGATLRVPFVELDDWPTPLAALRGGGFTVVALTPRKAPEALDTFAEAWRPGRIALLLGSEGAGLSSDAEALADRRVAIPIRPIVDSLNVAVAAGVALHQLTRQRAVERS
jgi:tRNA G18 (ribose-2'-O)-methylase SpoU